jgi:hypothetical protein
MAESVAVGYVPVEHTSKKFFRIFDRYFEDFLSCWNEKFGQKYGYYRQCVEHTVCHFLKCGDPQYGFAYLQCPSCDTIHLVPFTCKRKMCPTCGEKRKLEWVDWLFKEVVFDLRHRHWVFTLPTCIRWHFLKNRGLLSELSKVASKFLIKVLQASCECKDAIPGIVTVIQTAGDNLKWNPHLHIMATEGCLGEDNIYYPAGHLDYNVLRVLWRDCVIKMLQKYDLINDWYAQGLKKRYPKGFMLNGSIRDHFGDKNVMKRLAEYMNKAPISEKRILAFDDNKKSGKVLIQYRGLLPKSKQHGEYRSAKKLIELLNPLEFIARVAQHIPEKNQQMIRYYGIYSNAARGKRKKLDELGVPDIVEAEFVNRKSYRRSWRKLIYKIFGVDPMKCRKCGERLRIIKIYTDKTEINEFIKSYPSHFSQVVELSRAPPTCQLEEIL